MKKRSREINIFSLSALDLFASALGAFILISIILLPYFPNTGDSSERVAEVRAQMQAAIDELTRQRDEARAAAEEAQRALRRSFLLVVISWPREDDVDLHIVDPQGREFYFESRRFAGTPAAFEEDNIRGPGNEIWLHPQATAGEYRVYYKYYARRTSSVPVRGAVLHKEGRIALPNTTLSRQGEKPLIATIIVDDQGQVSLR